MSGFDIGNALELLAVPAVELLPALNVGSIAEITQIVTLAEGLVSIAKTVLKNKADADAAVIQGAIDAAQVGSDVMENIKFPKYE